MRTFKNKISKLPNSQVAFISTPGRHREIKRAYLKAFAEFLNTTLPLKARNYYVKALKTIKSNKEFTGGELAIIKNYVDEAVIKTIYKDTVENFKKKKEVQVLVNNSHPVNFFRRLKRANNIFFYLNSLKKEVLSGVEEKEEIEKIKNYFEFLNQCLTDGLIPSKKNEKDDTRDRDVTDKSPSKGAK